MQINLSTLAKHFSDEDAAYGLVESMRWPNGPICPHCGEVDHAYRINTRRKTTTGKVSDRRVWRCYSCRKQFSVLVGTIFHGSHVPLSKWLLACYMLNSSKNGVAAWEIHRTLGVTNKTAWFMMHRIREAMKVTNPDVFENTTVMVDETYIGGAEKNKHAWQRDPKASGRGTHKTPVLTLIDGRTGEARSRIIPNVTGRTLAYAILSHVDPQGSQLVSDQWAGYGPIGASFAKHVSVDHNRGEYRKEGVSTNVVEGYFSQLQRSIDGTHHHVSVHHLPRYLAEFDLRYTTRKMTDAQRFSMLMGQTNRRLSYRATTA